MTLQAGPEDRGQRLDIFLSRHLGQFTRSHIQTLNRSGAVRVGNQVEKAGYRIRGDETIEVDLQPSPSLRVWRPRIFHSRSFTKTMIWLLLKSLPVSWSIPVQVRLRTRWSMACCSNFKIYPEPEGQAGRGLSTGSTNGLPGF